MALVVFRSKAAAEIFMFAENARRILTIIGKNDTPKGVITVEQLPDAIARLAAAVDEEKAQLARARAEAGPDAVEDGAALRAITLGQRAYPILEMLRAALKRKVDVTWGV